VIDSNLNPISHRLATIRQLHTGRRQTTTHTKGPVLCRAGHLTHSLFMF